MKALLIEPKHLAVVKDILKDVGCEIFVFGSRANAKARKLSDLDLLFKGPISKQTLTRLRQDFEESELPFKVDIVVWENLDEAFKAHIRDDLLPLPP